MVSRGRVISRIGKSKSKAMARECGSVLNCLCRSLSREVRFSARVSNDIFCDQVSFAINAVSIVEPDIGYYLLSCVGYNETRQILKSIRRHDRKKLEGH